MSDLDKLIVAVEAGTLCAGEFSISADDMALIEAVFPMDDNDEVPEFIGMAMDGSLDAAERLHEALLPGWRWEVGTHLGGTPIAQVWDVGTPVQAQANEPARAWLLAILRAVKAKEAGNE